MTGYRSFSVSCFCHGCRLFHVFNWRKHHSRHSTLCMDNFSIF